MQIFTEKSNSGDTEDTAQQRVRGGNPTGRRRRNAIVDALSDVTNEDIRRLHGVRDSRQTRRQNPMTNSRTVSRNTISTVFNSTNGITRHAVTENVAAESLENSLTRRMSNVTDATLVITNSDAEFAVSPVTLHEQSCMDRVDNQTVMENCDSCLALNSRSSENLQSTDTESYIGELDNDQNIRTISDNSPADENTEPLPNYNLKRRRNAICHENSTSYLLEMVLAKAGKR